GRSVMAETPQTPNNPFREGADKSIDAQKIALTEALAQQGSQATRVIQNRGADAAALAQAAGQAANPLYQTFNRDAQQAQDFQNNELARIQAANQAYMEQAKAALPIHQRDTDAYYE